MFFCEVYTYLLSLLVFVLTFQKRRENGVTELCDCVVKYFEKFINHYSQSKLFCDYKLMQCT